MSRVAHAALYGALVVLVVGLVDWLLPPAPMAHALVAGFWGACGFWRGGQSEASSIKERAD